MKTIIVKVVKSSKPKFWYADCIGEEFEVFTEPTGGDDHKTYEVVKQPCKGITNLLNTCDVEIIK
jgi:hypothetical protein